MGEEERRLVSCCWEEQRHRPALLFRGALCGWLWPRSWQHGECSAILLLGNASEAQGAVGLKVAGSECLCKLPLLDVKWSGLYDKLFKQRQVTWVELHLRMHWNPFSPRSSELYWLDLMRNLQFPPSWNLFKCSPFLKEHIPTLIYFKTAFRRCHPCDEVLGLCCQCVIKNWISDIWKSHSSQCHSLTALHVTLQHSITDPFPVGGRKRWKMRESKICTLLLHYWAGNSLKYVC